jgi:transglutaminase-like putative cysteine protease
MDKNIWYSKYYNFTYSPETIVKKRHGNCCDQTRLFLQLCDAAGLMEYYHMYYCSVPGHVYAIVKNKKTGKWVYVDCASDYHTAWGYVCQGYAHGSPSNGSKYPNKPF